MREFIESLDVESLKDCAFKFFENTGKGAKQACTKAKDDIDCMNPDLKKAITVGVAVFAIVVAVAGVFYLLGKKAGRKEQIDVEYEEWGY